MKLEINGKKVTNPIVKFFVSIFVMLTTFGILLFVGVMHLIVFVIEILIMSVVGLFMLLVTALPFLIVIGIPLAIIVMITYIIRLFL